MKISYNSFAIDSIGEFTVSQTREYEEGQRARVSLKVGVSLFQRSYADNLSLINQLKSALLSREAVLQWTDTDTNTDYLNQTVTLQSDDLPDEWGTYQMNFNLVFFYFEQNLATNNLPLLFSPGTGPTLTLGNVSKFSESYTAERFSPFHSPRSIMKGKIEVSGFLLVDTTVDLDDRRTALIASKVALESGLLSKEGTLQFGASGSVFNRVVRVEECRMEIDQLHYAVNFSFSASFTVYPDETNFATVEYQVNQRDDNSGQLFLSFGGKITSGTEFTARAKLAALLATVLTQYGYASAQQVKNETSANQVSANADGDFFNELTFSFEYRNWRSDNQKASFIKTGNNQGIPFGNVNGWVLQYSARRFNDMRSQRQRAGGTISARGTWSADPTLDLPGRRSQLLAAQQAMMTEVNGADGLLSYGSFNQVVRIEDLRAEINQAITGIDWSFTALYSLFPAESGYATVEFTVAQNSNVEDGEETLAFSGTILAPDESMARAKLTSVRTAMLASYGYSIAQQLRPQSTVRGVFANGDKTATLAGHEGSDGTSFIELTFSEEYRRRRSNLVNWTMQTSSRSDVATGLILTTYSGHVIASGSTASAAYSAAFAKAVSLGSGQESTIGGNAFLRNSQINWDQRQSEQDNVIEFVRLTFSYEYQSKIGPGLAYLEVNTETLADSFGNDSIAVSGFIIATDAPTALGLYHAQVRDSFNSQLIQGERTTQGRVLAQNSGGFAAQDIRLEFSFTVFVQKASGVVTYRYGISVSNDYLQLLRMTQIRGSVYASSSAAASAAVTTLLGTLANGSLVKDEQTIDREYTSASTQDVFLKLDFSAEYASAITGIAGVLEMRITESIKYSGVRWVKQPIPRDSNGNGGVSILQDGGIEEGSRTVRGSVTAATLSVAESWARRQRAMLTGDNSKGFYPQAEEMDIDYEFVPRVDGVIIGVGTNVRMYRANFSFSEILPNYAPPS